jgi:hypothetical protein
MGFPFHLIFYYSFVPLSLSFYAPKNSFNILNTRFNGVASGRGASRARPLISNNGSWDYNNKQDCKMQLHSSFDN